MYEPLNDRSWSDIALATAQRQCRPGKEDKVYVGWGADLHIIFLTKTEENTLVVRRSNSPRWSEVYVDGLDSATACSLLETVVEEWFPENAAIPELMIAIHEHAEQGKDPVIN